MLQWIIAGLVLIVIELVSPTAFFFFCLGIGAIAAGLSALLTEKLLIQAVVFCVVSVASIYSIRPMMKKLLHTEDRASNVDALLNQEALVTEKIEPPHMGMVKVQSELWRAEAGEVIEAGAMVKVLSAQGNHLIVTKK
jgi:membrane protein implicated in regulation of membrane protease activity